MHELDELVRCCDVLAELLLQRRGGGKHEGGREGWAVRLTHKAYSDLSKEYQPWDYIPSPAALVQTLITQISAVRGCRATFLRAKERAPTMDRPSSSSSQRSGGEVVAAEHGNESAGVKLKRSIADAKAKAATTKAAASGAKKKKKKKKKKQKTAAMR